jgi:proline dehydrogenase
LQGAAALAIDIGAKTAKLGREKTEQAARKSWTVCRAGLKTLAMPLMKRVARNYVAGDSLDDARRVCHRLADQGILSTIAFWDTEHDQAQAVADQYLAGLNAMAEDRLGAYLSIKLPALRYSEKLLAEIAARCQTTRTPLHFDAMAPDTVDRTWKAIESIHSKTPDVRVGCTLPGRWQRSVADALWAAEHDLPVRVVKGQWVDPDAPAKDLTEGYLEVIDALAGTAVHVSVATHDPILATEAIRRLQTAGTPCDLELIHGLPMKKCLTVAQRLGVSVRVYVPYGEAYMPYALSQIRKNPRIVTWLLKDLLATVLGR